MVKLAIDIDGTINACQQSIEWFKLLTSLLIPEHKIYIITSRLPGSEAEIADELFDLGVSYSQIVITDDKADYIRKEGITIFFENEDRFFLELGEEVVVFKIREDGNFCFTKEHKWIGDKRTTKIID